MRPCACPNVPNCVSLPQGQRTEELSMAQLTTLQELQRAFAVQLEDVRTQLVRRQEREAVEERMQLELEKRAR